MITIGTIKINTNQVYRYFSGDFVRMPSSPRPLRAIIDFQLLS